ncbi:hypothetical protein M422DRAFT_245913 [Sphaerobolus stellatus SS14]|nr:hypothetical protein M422DRAFT_245913 [Sphaerobolus stellatus SS14]
MPVGTETAHLSGDKSSWERMDGMMPELQVETPSNEGQHPGSRETQKSGQEQGEGGRTGEDRTGEDETGELEETGQGRGESEGRRQWDEDRESEQEGTPELQTTTGKAPMERHSSLSP